MRKVDLISAVSERAGVSTADTTAVIEVALKEIKSELLRGGRVDLRGFGNFILQKRKAKIARVISRNESMPIPACYIPKVRFAKDFVTKIKRLEVK